MMVDEIYINSMWNKAWITHFSSETTYVSESKEFYTSQRVKRRDTPSSMYMSARYMLNMDK